MATTKYTPGPWFITKDNGDTIQVTSSDFIVADVTTGEFEEEGLANANLIAALPDLFQALENLVSLVFEMKGHGIAENSVQMQEAVKAIAKANGE